MNSGPSIKSKPPPPNNSKFKEPPFKLGPLIMGIRSNHCTPEKINLAEYVSLAKETLSFVECLPAVTATQAIHMPEFVQCLKEVPVPNVFITTAAL